MSRAGQSAAEAHASSSMARHTAVGSPPPRGSKRAKWGHSDSAREERRDEEQRHVAPEPPQSGVVPGERFQWRKKELRDQQRGLTREEAERRDAERREDAAREVAQLHAKRAQRERARALREDEEARKARAAESSAMAAWSEKEDEFQLEQARRRAVIRARNRRAKPIDLLVLCLHWSRPRDATTSGIEAEEDEASADIELREPSAVVDALSLADAEEVHEHIRTFLELEKDDYALRFWRSLLIVCDDKLKALHGTDAASAARLDPSIVAETDAMLSSKTEEELLRLQRDVRAKLRSGEPLDVEYWESLLRRIVVWRGTAHLRAVHSATHANRTAFLREQQRANALRHRNDLAQQTATSGNASSVDEPVATYTDEMEPAVVDLEHLSQRDRKLPVVSLKEQRESLLRARIRVLRGNFAPHNPTAPTKPAQRAATQLDAMAQAAAQDMLRFEAEQLLDGIDEYKEEVFNEDIRDERLVQPVYQWEDKYRARKPRYYNRVHAGYEWNQYNQTHYDANNPPPKVVQGYKFNIFYPDLIDKTKTPTYRIIRGAGDDKDTALLRFSAGPPYEDIAFRIVDREWECSHRRGFRSSFDRGILQLYCACMLLCRADCSQF